MKATISSLAVLALISNVSALRLSQEPDVYGPNGKNYQNENA